MRKDPAIPPPTRALRLACLLVSLLFASSPAIAQDRPLQTPDASIVPAGTLRAEVGFDFLQGITYPVSGLNGDQTNVGVVDLRLGVGRMVEVQLLGAVQQFLDIKQRGTSFVQLTLPAANSTSDTGDYSLWTKIRLKGESGHSPAAAFRFGFEMPNTNQARGIGTNTTNVFAEVILEKHFGNLKLFGDVGIGILQSPLSQFSQNDVLLYGGAFSYPVVRRVTLVGEVAGRRNTRKLTTSLLGTESRSQARFGFQIFAGGFQWDVAGIAGLNRFDPDSGLTFGVSRDIHLFSVSGEPK